MKNITPNLQLVVAKQSPKAPSVTLCCIATSDTTNSFEDFHMEFLSHYWSDSIQTKVPVDIYQRHYNTHGNQSYVGHMLKYAVKAKYAEPQMTPSQLLGAIQSLSLPHLQKLWSKAYPKNLQQAVTFLSDM